MKCVHLFWSETLCSSVTSTGSECCVSPLMQDQFSLILYFSAANLQISQIAKTLQ